MPRLGYKKSRGGCARCKQRRVKLADVLTTQCDEKKPCSACIRHNTQCSLAENGLSVSSESSAWSSQNQSGVASAPSLPRRTSSRKGSSSIRKNHASSISPVGPSMTPPSLLEATRNLPADFVSDRASSIGNRGSSLSASSPDPFPYFVKFSTGPVDSVHLSKWITDLELMHQYSTVTCFAMPRSSDVSHVWQVEVPKLGLTYMFLMHQILATGALHLGHLHPEQRESYALHASQHQTDAIAGMRESLTHITHDNCHSLFATSCLLLICAYSSFPYQRGSSQGHEAPTVDDVLDVFLLVRGMSHILSSSQPIIEAGPFASFFTEAATPASTPLLDAVVQHLQTFRAGLETSDMNPPSRDIVIKEVDGMLEWIAYATSTTAFPELRVAMTWPINLSDEFMQMLRDRDPAALILLAYYSVIIRSTESSTWFMRGWGINVARTITSDLDPAWKEMIKWPMAFISDRTIQF
ncbi:Sterol uptake control protein 2-like protein 6 [Colletotrichum chlorophyti]|uniref:Sterol uptake control protein 2-like protein 6 n=1 Tax=Colletotrichum chlorophyti TaxID=708187 RepID=A0A1Q8S492_9PEZI|nr:Sterol uptake control protein 2-like protein 6 [Colletotrichum chlorophyti]